MEFDSLSQLEGPLPGVGGRFPAHRKLSGELSSRHDLCQVVQELALTVARHITNAESASTVARIAGRLPAHREADLSEDPLLAGFAIQAENAIPQPNYVELDEVWGYAADMITQVLRDSKTPEEAVLEAATLINEANRK